MSVKSIESSAVLFDSTDKCKDRRIGNDAVRYVKRHIHFFRSGGGDHRSRRVDSVPTALGDSVWACVKKN